MSESTVNIKTTIAGSLPKPSWLAKPQVLWAPWQLEGEQLAEGKRDAVRAELGEVIVGKKTGRRDANEVIVYDATGTALQDVAAAVAWVVSDQAPMLIGQTIHLDGGFADAAWSAVLGE